MKSVNEYAVSESLPLIVLDPVSRMDLIRYAGASGDYNPIHTIDVEAERAGLPGVIAHGMWTMGNLAKMFTPYFEEGFVSDYTVRFKGMVFLQDVITLQATLKEKQEKQIVFKVVASNQNDQMVIKGDVIFTCY